MKTPFAFLALACCLFTTAAFGFPTLTGPSGLLALPTTSVIDAGDTEITADYYFIHQDAAAVKDGILLHVLYGSSADTEIGIGGWLTRTGGKDVSVIQVNAKHLTSWDIAGIAFAVGASVADTSKDASPGYTHDALSWDAYLVGTDVMIPDDDHTIGIIGTLGANWAGLEAGAIHGNGGRGMAGLEVRLPNMMSLLVEYQTAQPQAGDVRPLSSLAVRIPFTAALTGQLGYTNAGLATGGLAGAREHNIMLCVSYCNACY